MINIKIKCPTCSIEQEYTPSNPSRPFCSERCKLIDLGEWASESRVIEGEPVWEELMPDNSDPEH